MAKKKKKPFDPRVDEDGYFQSSEAIGPRRYSTLDHFRDLNGKVRTKKPVLTLTPFAQAILDAAENKKKKSSDD